MNRKSEEPFTEKLIIISVAKHFYSNIREAHDEIERLFMGMFGEVNTFGDLPETYMAYHDDIAPVCSAFLMGNTRVNDEYVMVSMYVQTAMMPVPIIKKS